MANADYTPANPRHDAEYYTPIVEWIEEYRDQNGYPPTTYELAAAFPADNGNPASNSVIRYKLDRMVELGLITRKPGVPRSIVPRVPVTHRKRTATR